MDLLLVFMVYLNKKIMKTILVATDFSQAADKAVAYAAAMARHFGAKLVLFNAFQPPPSTSASTMAVPSLNKLLTENRARLQSLASRIAQFHGIETVWVSNISYVEEELVEQVNLHLADLVVMGMKRGTQERWLFGSSTTAVIGRAKFPVLIVPEQAYFNGISRILFAYDEKTLSGNDKLRFLNNLMKEFNARLQVLHIEKPVAQNFAVANNSSDANQANQARQTSQAEQARKMPVVFNEVQPAYRDMEEENVILGIEKGLQEFGADLLVMIPHKPGFWDMIFKKSHTRKMILKTPVPLLTLPEEK